MKKLITLSAILILTLSVYAQAPQKMSYQAVIRDYTENLITNHQIGIKISILQSSTSGSVVYTETQTPTTNENGLISIEIGGGAGFSSIDWASDIYFLKTEIDPSGGSSYSISGTTQLLSVPYALHSQTVDNTGISITSSQVSDFQTSVSSNTDVAAAKAQLDTIATVALTGSYNDLSDKPAVPEHHIGELYGGGIVVAVWIESGIEKGLIASLTNLGTTSEAWSSVTTGAAPAQSFIDGQVNTTAAITQGATSGAVYICDNYTNPETGTGVYSDWYLPAQYELFYCWRAAHIVSTVLGFTDGFYPGGDYWSSSEYTTTTACKVNFAFGSSTYVAKTTGYRVRAVRRF